MRTPRWPALRRGSPLHRPSRRGLLQGVAAACGLSLGGGLLSRPARASSGVAQRIIFFYVPDGVPAASATGEASAWHASGSEWSFSLPTCTAPLESFRSQCLFINGLSLGGTDAGSHPGGAKKLLTAADYGNNESIDQYLARTAGAASPWRHLYLGVQANYASSSSDQHISYPVAGSSISPEDDPRVAFEALFGAPSTTDSGGDSGGDSGAPVDPTAERRRLVIDTLLGDLNELQGRLGAVEKAKLDLHKESLYELENRLGGAGAGEPVGDGASCAEPAVDMSGVTDDLYAPERFPAQLKAQIDTLVLAMECGLTRTATLQCSYHTSELIMSRFAGTEMYDPSYDMRSHQASHYGDRHDEGLREYAAFEQQSRWWVEQLVYLLEQLDARAEGEGTMLDNSLVVFCTEVCDGNNHLHDNMPFIVAGGGGGRIRGGRLLDVGYARHGDLYVALAQAMGVDTWSFGDASAGPLSGILD
jgi:hypothetical protein